MREDNSKPPALDEHTLFVFWTVLRQTYALLVKNQERSLAEHGLNMSQYLCLFITKYSTRPVTASALASYLSQEAPSVTYALGRLQGRGLIERKPSPSDRREALLTLTPEGEAVLKAANSAAWRPLLEVSKPINDEAEVHQTIRFLLSLRDRGAELLGVSIGALDFATEHKIRDPFMWEPPARIETGE